MCIAQGSGNRCCMLSTSAIYSKLLMSGIGINTQAATFSVSPGRLSAGGAMEAVAGEMTHSRSHTSWYVLWPNIRQSPRRNMGILIEGWFIKKM